MSSQLALDLPAPAADGGEIQECKPGDELLADLAAISSMIPWFGKRANTARADLLRPIVYLYGRPAVMSTIDQRVCCAASRGLFRHQGPESHAWYRLHQLAFARGLCSSGGALDGDFWVRVSGEKEGVTARDLVRRVSRAVQIQPWLLEIASGLGNDIAKTKAEAVCGDVLRALQMTCAGWKAMGSGGFVVPHLAPLVLAMRWEPALEAAVILARHGVLPGVVVPLDIEIPRHTLEAMYAQHGVLDRPAPTKTISTVDLTRTWDALVDVSVASGQPWAERLYAIGKLPPSSPVARALRWVSEQTVVPSKFPWNDAAERVG